MKRRLKMRLLPLLAITTFAAAPVLAADPPMGPGPAGRVNAATPAGFATLDACKSALAAEIARQRDNASARPEWARKADGTTFAENQTKLTECRADGAVFRVYVKRPPR
jgi:hypothetical protein